MLTDKVFWFGMTAMLVNLGGYVPYIRGIFTGTVKPQRITWGIWMILTSIAFVNQIRNGGGYSSYFFGSTAVLVSIVFLLSFKRGMGGKTTFDLVVLSSSMVLFAAWAFTQDTRTTTLIAIAIDCTAALPTLYKSYVHPETEVYIAWITAAIAGFLTMLAIEKDDYILFVYPAFIIVMNLVIVAAKYVGTRRIAANAQSEIPN